jgi:predicted ATPase
MIHRLTIENFRSFNQKIELDFTAKPEKAGHSGYAETKTGEVVSRVNMLIGPNASGKSNVLKALAVLHWALVQSAEQNAKTFPYLFQFSGNPPLMHISMECSDGAGELFRYTVTLSPGAIFSEERLAVRSTMRAQWKILFDRRAAMSRKETENTFVFKETAGDWATIPQRPNASLIGSRVLAGTRPGVPSDEHELARRIQALAANSLNNVASEFDEPQGLWWHGIGRKLSQDESLLRQAGVFMKNADIGITALNLHKFKVRDQQTGTGTQEIIHPIFKHAISSKEVPLPFHLESCGTRILLDIFTGAYPVAAKSGVIALDEIERGIHPHLLPELVRALTPPDTSSQLFLVSHSDYLLRVLEHDQVFLTEKQDDGSTDIYRADAIEGFKADRNLLNWYHAGKLGAIPNR